MHVVAYVCFCLLVDICFGVVLFSFFWAEGEWRLVYVCALCLFLVVVYLVLFFCFRCFLFVCCVGFVFVVTV